MVNTATLAGLDGMNSYEVLSAMWGISTGWIFALMIIVSIWSLVWKGFALWKSANKKSIPWFVVLLIFNTIGILDILYIFVFSKITFKTKKTQPKPKTKKKK